MSKDKSLIILKENSVFSNIVKFIKGIFSKKNKSENETNVYNYVEEKQKEMFLSNLQESTKAEQNIEKVMTDTTIVYNMSIQELKNLNNSIKIKQDILNQRVRELKAQIANLM